MDVDSDMINFKNKHIILILAVAALSFSWNVLLTASFERLNSPPKAEANPDQVEYELFAYRMSAGKGFSLPSGEATACRPPGTSLTLLPVYLLFGRSFFLGRLWFCLLAATTCLATAWIAKQAFGSKEAVWSALWLAFYPGHFYYALHFLSETPFGLWLALACGFSLRALRTSTGASNLIAGGFWGLAILTRPQTLLVMPLALICLFVLSWLSRKRLARSLSLQICSTLLTITPWIARNTVVIGKPALCTIVGGFTFWGAHNDVVASDPRLQGSWIACGQLADSAHPLRGNEVEREAAAWRYGKEFIKANPEAMPRLLIMKIIRIVSPFTETSNRIVRLSFAVGWLLTVPLLALGVLISTRRNPLATAVLAIPCLATLATALIFYGSDRFRDGLSPAWMVFVGVAIADLSSRWSKQQSNPLRIL
jgi:4-amino-4-deoxy-L-arabinose transferase-like glycosyltransferase